jgi:hypothetical protein
LGEQREYEDVVGNRREREHGAVEHDGCLRKVVFAHPAGRKRQQRQPEQQVQIGPQDRTAHTRAGLEQVVVVVPVDAEIHETQHVAQEHRQQAGEVGKARTRRLVMAVRNLHLEHHDGDDDGEHAIAERFESTFVHEGAV